MSDAPMPFDQGTPRRTVAPERLDHLPVFPLPGAVLIPQGHLPLHIFEPRYRALVTDCMDGDRVLAIAQLEREERSYLDRPPLRRVAGVGIIDVHQSLPDGRALIVLRGIMRVAIRAEVEVERPYRVVRALAVGDDPLAGATEAAEGMTIVRQLVQRLGGLIPDEAGKTLIELCQRERDPGRLADLVGSAVVLESDARQRFLEQTDVLRRLDETSAALAAAIEQLTREKERPLN